MLETGSESSRTVCAKSPNGWVKLLSCVTENISLSTTKVPSVQRFVFSQIINIV